MKGMINVMCGFRCELAEHIPHETGKPRMIDGLGDTIDREDLDRTTHFSPVIPFLLTLTNSNPSMDL